MEQRELLFRAWLPDEETMLYSDNQSDPDLMEHWTLGANTIEVQLMEERWKEGGGEIYETSDWVTPRQIIMQYTGLKDKIGNKIYENDICHCCGEDYHVCLEELAGAYKLVNIDTDCRKDDVHFLLNEHNIVTVVRHLYCKTDKYERKI